MQTQAQLERVLRQADPGQRERARKMTDNLCQIFRPDALLAERTVLEMIEAMFLQAASGSVSEPRRPIEP